MIRRFLSACALTLAALALAAGPALAVNTAKEMDADGDGRISKQEYMKNRKDKKQAEKDFKSLDHDKDGYLTRKDILGLFNMVDTNHDGKITPDEAKKRWKRFDDFGDRNQAVDGNRDGWWSPEELWQVYPGSAPGYWW